MDDSCLLALDCGTSSLRAVLLDSRGRVLDYSERILRLTRPGAGRVEQQPELMLRLAHDAIDEVLAAAPSAPVACGIAVQRSSVVCWDRERLVPLSPVLSWQDTRAADRLEPHAGCAAEIARRTGLRLSPHYGASKLAWCLDQLPAVREAARAGRLAMGPLAAWLLAGLAKEAPCAVDHANASRTLLWNLATRNWDPTLIERFGLPPEALPACWPIRFPHGRLPSPQWRGGVRIAALTGDQNAAVFADGPLPEDVALVNLGTGAFALRTSPAPNLDADDGLLRGVADSAADDASYLVEGTVNGAGAAFDWAEEYWDLAPVAPRLDALLTRVREPEIVINAVGGLGSPWWRHDVSTHAAETGPRDPDRLATGLAESILFMLRTNLDLLAAAGPPLRTLRLSGGLTRSTALCARLAALCGLPVEVAADPEATARGVAYLAAGRPSGWSRAPFRRIDPVDDPALQRRYESWLALMRDLS